MIFLDRSIPKSVANAIKLVRSGDVFWLEDMFPHNAKDEDWIPVIGTLGWFFVARDKKIRTRPWQREIVRRHAVGCFIINQKRDPTRWEYLKLLAHCLDDMQAIHRSIRPPYMFLVNSQWQLRQFHL